MPRVHVPDEVPDHQSIISRMLIYGDRKRNRYRVELGLRMAKELQVLSGNPRLRMVWVRHWSLITKRYRIVLEGWPVEVQWVEFAKLRTLQLKQLLELWRENMLRFRKIDEEEFEQLLGERQRLLTEGVIVGERPIQPRRDRGMRHPRQNLLTRGKKRFVPIKSPAMIDSEDEEDEAKQKPETETVDEIEEWDDAGRAAGKNSEEIDEIEESQ